MFKANEQLVAHNTNINLVGIRNAEINYFSAFFSNFGTQCALIAGFILSSISQVPGLDAECSIFWKYFYWMTTAICFVTSMHVLLCTVFIAVYGQGLALRGPVGSMVRAVEGMVVEQEHVVFSFVISIIFFTLSTVGTYWIMMDEIGALISSIISILGMIFWYHYTLRIYNRFKWSKVTETTWDKSKGEEVDEQPEYVLEREASLKRRSELLDAKANNDNDKTDTSVSNPMFAHQITKANDPNQRSLGSKPGAPVTQLKMREGNISLRTKKSGGLFSGNDTWERVYMVITDSNSLCFYKSKKDYQEKPEAMLRNRPMHLSDCSLVVESDQAPFILKIVPAIENDAKAPLSFKMDHVSELNLWYEVLSKSIEAADNMESKFKMSMRDDDFVIVDKQVKK